ncbi:MAG: MFS transporter [Hamadaea sp.]|nr:MFS transporter [Hamadaea sp.]
MTGVLGSARPARFTLLSAAYSITSYGTFLNMIALGLFALDLTRSALQTGMFMAIRLSAGVVAGPIAGWLAGRAPRRALMVGSDLLCATAIVALAVWPSAGLLYAVAVVVGAAGTQWGVAMRSAVPDLVGQQERARANSRLVAGRSIAMLLGFASAGVLVSRFGYETVFVVDAASYVLCAALLTGVPIRRAERGAASRPDGAGARSWWGLAGLAPLLVGMIAVRTADAFGSASHNVALPVYAQLVNADDPAAFAAAFTTAWAVGSLAVGRWLARTNRAGGEKGFGIATALMSVFFVLAFTGLPIWLLIPVAAAAGAADGYAEISYTSRLQAADGAVRAQLFGFATAVQNAGFGLGMIGCAALLEVLDPFTVVASAHSAALLATLVFVAVMYRPGRVRAVQVTR